MLIRYEDRLFWISQVPQSRSIIFGSTQQKPIIRADRYRIYLFCVSLECQRIFFKTDIPYFNSCVVTTTGKLIWLIIKNPKTIHWSCMPFQQRYVFIYFLLYFLRYSYPICLWFLDWSPIWFLFLMS